MPARNHHSWRVKQALRLGDPQLDRYLEFVESRARHNTLLATTSDLRAFFRIVDKPPSEVTPADVLGFIAAQRKPRGDGKVVRLVDGEAGLSARTIKRRLSSVSGLYSYLSALRRRGGQPRSSGTGHPTGRWSGPGTHQKPADVAEDPVCRRGERPHRRCCARIGTGPWSRPWSLVV